ncbi:MAG TPA: ABC transporter substrate-binding protein, partial [Nitrolancea sp.]|nr:ABC transporter substrate-binding protein [Nitrolancea sp.]
LHRRDAVRALGLSGLTLLAACTSKSSTDNEAGSTATSGGTSGDVSTAAATSGSGAATPATSGSPAASAEATTPPKQGGELAIAVDQEPPTLDPLASPSAITFTMTTSASESLLFLTDKRELQPWLATSYEASPDGTSVTFKLRDDVTFQDGTAFNADAVKWNLDRIVDPNFKAGASLSTLSGYTGSEVVDPQTIKVSFKEPYAPFLTYAGSPFLVFLSPEGTQKQGNEVTTKPITTGPYQFTEYVAKDHAKMTRWDGYKRKAPWADHDGPGFLDSITWRFVPEAATRSTTVETGEVQVATPISSPQDIQRFKSSKDVKIEQADWVGVPLVILLNTQKAPTDDINVRKAINQAIDKQSMINTLFAGTGKEAYSYLAQALLPTPELKDMYPFDLDKANQMLDDGGWAKDGDFRSKDGQPLKIILNTIDYGGGPDPTSEFIQGQLRAAGIDVEIKAQARPPFYEDNYNGATHASTIFLRIGEYDSIYSLFHSKYIGANFNWSRLNDPDIDAALEQGRQEMDPEKRKQLYIDLQKKLMEIAPGVPLIDQYSVWALRSNVSGLKFNGFTYPIVSDLSMS